MNNANVTLGILNIGFAVLIVALSIPLVMRKVKMNRFYGVRIPKSFSSEANWYAINAYGGRQLIAWSLLPLVCGILCVVFRLDQLNSGLGTVIGAAPILLTCLITLIQVMRFARTLEG